MIAHRLEKNSWKNSNLVLWDIPRKKFLWINNENGYYLRTTSSLDKNGLSGLLRFCAPCELSRWFE